MKLRYVLGMVVVVALAAGGYAFYHNNQASAADNDSKTLPGFVQDPANPVVARVGNDEIRQSDILAILKNVDLQGQKVPPQALLGMILDRMINTKLIYDDAVAKKMDQDADLQKKMADAQKQVLVEAYAQDLMKDKLTPAALKARYKKFLKDTPSEEEVHARHILLKTKEEAEAVIKQLQGGADFAALAKEKSADPSAVKNAGDLGYFTKEIMVQPFAEAAFAAKPNTLITTPVKTDFGWHVIKVEDRRKTTPPKFEAVEPQLRNMIAQETLQDILQKLATEQHVQRFNWDGSPAAPAPATAAP